MKTMKTPEDVKNVLKDTYGIELTDAELEMISSMRVPVDINQPISVSLRSPKAIYNVYRCSNRRPPRPMPDGTKKEMTENVEITFSIGDTYLKPIM